MSLSQVEDYDVSTGNYGKYSLYAYSLFLRSWQTAALTICRNRLLAAGDSGGSSPAVNPRFGYWYGLASSRRTFGWVIRLIKFYSSLGIIPVGMFPTLEGSTVWCVSGKWPGGGSEKLKSAGIPGVYKPHARDCRSHEVVLPSTYLTQWLNTKLFLAWHIIYKTHTEGCFYYI